ncbi:efflux transporter, RND family, MFP subunit [Caenispirillum salinarum AK4]|uniref:Efflux transporter, RND family, MFP subunit n=1 Tax=Caenispirillum salinarum AK4 TaxID=1238182 RepID=K9GND2_9PROT|nr:efflux RND transporter periplasmic adaptor subunit [Caenispirillum salinarum]EKV26592.1 efflux transporter, RND family, MFP subunit [Caenispirillum salinarum AK4]
MVKRLLWLLPLLILAAGVWAYADGVLRLPWQETAAGAGGGAEASRARPAKPVAVAPVERVTITDELTANGTVRATESVTVAAEASGTVEEVMFEHGAEVDKGAPLVRLDTTEAEAELSAARAELETARRAFDRARQLRANGTIAQGPFDDAQAALEAARTQVALAEVTLRKRTVAAPFAGQVGFREISPGAYLQPGDEITTLDAIERVYVDFMVAEDNLARVERGQTVTLQSVARPDAERTGAVLTVAPRVDPVSRQARVRAQVDNADGLLRPGQLVLVNVATARRETIMVPASAVVPVGYQHFAFIVGEDGTAQRRTVTLGRRTADRVEITAGIEPGERLVIEGAAKLRGGDAVRMVDPLAVDASRDTDGGATGAVPAET